MSMGSIIFWMQPLNAALPDIVRMNERDLDPGTEEVERSRIVTLAVAVSSKATHVPIEGGGWVGFSKYLVMGEIPVTEASEHSGKPSVIVATTKWGAEPRRVRHFLQAFLSDHQLEASDVAVAALTEGMA